MSNVIGLIKEDLQRHKVTVKLPNEQEERSLFLIEITGKTSKLNDLEMTYGSEMTPVHKKIIKKFFGEDETENVYGVLVDDDLRMVFAFNRDFADYNAEKKSIVYKDIDDLLLDMIEVKETKESPIPHTTGRKLPKGIGGRGIVRYSLTEK